MTAATAMPATIRRLAQAAAGRNYPSSGTLENTGSLCSACKDQPDPKVAPNPDWTAPWHALIRQYAAPDPAFHQGSRRIPPNLSGGLARFGYSAANTYVSERVRW